MNLTIARFKKELKCSVKTQLGADIDIIDACWVGKKSKARDGSSYFFRHGQCIAKVNGQKCKFGGMIDSDGGGHFYTLSVYK